MKTKILSNLASVSAMRTFTLAAAAYYLVEKSGLFRAIPASPREILHSKPFLFLAILFAVNACARLYLRPASAPRASRAGWLCIHLSVIILVAALWVSYFTRFEGKAIRMQEQTFNGFPNDYIQGSVHMGRFGHFPKIGILMHVIAPQATSDGGRLSKVEAAISYAGPATNGPTGGRLSSRWPLFSDWTMVNISDFGYMVRFLVEDPWHRQVDSDYVHMKLFPAGKEDFFKSYLLPYSFFLKLYPDYQATGGHAATQSPYLKNPLFHLRLTRNKDIVYDDMLKPTEHLRFEEFVLSLPEVRMWVEMSFVRDLGLPVAVAGLLLMLSGMILTAFGKMRETKGNAQ